MRDSGALVTAIASRLVQYGVLASQRRYAAGLRQTVGRTDDHLAGHAPPVGALTANQLALHPDDLKARLSQFARCVLPTGTEPYDDNIHAVVCHDEPFPNNRLVLSVKYCRFSDAGGKSWLPSTTTVSSDCANTTPFQTARIATFLS